MKKRGILQAALAEAIASMGHTDLLVVADAGLPVPPGVQCIDLAVRCGVPGFLDVVSAIADELQIEHVIFADELLQRSDVMPQMLHDLIPDAPQEHCPHEEFKLRTANARAVVRTGECTPYHNVILQAGVVF